MKNLTLENITRACQGKYYGDKSLLSTEIQGAVTDSRQVEEGFLFIPIKGERVDAHDFIPQVFEQGALVVLSEKKLENPAGPYIRVKSTTEAMKQIAAFYREQLDIPFIGIIGSVGKTSTKEMVASVLSQKYDVLKTAGNFNNEIGLPLTIFRIRDNHQVAVVEMGISYFDEMHRLGQVAKPDYAIITNIGYCHLENLIDRDGVLKAKTEVFDHMKDGGLAILNGDDDKLISKKIVNGKEAVFYGIGDNSDKLVYATDVENLGFEGMTAVFHCKLGDFPVKINIPGLHNVYNALAACAIAIELGLNQDEIVRGIEEAQTIAGRTNLINADGKIIIDDCYNANPVSMKASIEVLANAKGRTIAVLGDMGELGATEDKLHYEVGTAVGENKIHALFCAGDLAVNYAKAAKLANPDCDVHYFKTAAEMTSELTAYVRQGDSILVKASHFMEFPKVVEALQK